MNATDTTTTTTTHHPAPDQQQQTTLGGGGGGGPAAAAAAASTLNIDSDDVYARLESCGFNLYEVLSGEVKIPEITAALSASAVFQDARRTFREGLAWSVAAICSGMLLCNGAHGFTTRYLHDECLGQHQHLSYVAPKQLCHVLRSFFLRAIRLRNAEQVRDLADLFGKIVLDPPSARAAAATNLDPMTVESANAMHRVLELIARALMPPSSASQSRHMIGCLHNGGIPEGRGQDDILRHCIGHAVWFQVSQHMFSYVLPLLRDHWGHALYMQQEKRISMRIAGTIAGLVDVIDGFQGVVY